MSVPREPVERLRGLRLRDERLQALGERREQERAVEVAESEKDGRIGSAELIETRSLPSFS
jgi:hypothetical protein